MPYEQNHFFTGREEDLKRLEEALLDGHTTALSQTQAISGLGGIGKTQTAVEYAYRHRADYAAVFWTAADTAAALTTGFVEIARLLDLPQAQEADQLLAVEAVKRWLETHERWLLIADNADQPELLKDFRPRRMSGHMLLTSRAQVFDMLGVTRPVVMETLRPKEATDFLRHRTGRDKCGAEERAAAAELAKELGNLPLALEQAGAYVSATQALFADYLVSYRKRRLDLLEQRAPVAGEYPASVATTWSLNFTQVTAASAAAADLLRASAYLSHDRIPLELLTRGGSELGGALSAALSDVDENPVALDEVLVPLLRYSLVSRDVESRAYSIHRLVQVVLRAELAKEEEERLWAERVVRALSQTFPSVDYENWSLCERLIPHVEAAARLIESHDLGFTEAWRLLSEAGVYYRSRGQYRAAAALLEQALRGLETLGKDQPELGSVLNNLASVYERQGRYKEAEPLFERALSIKELAHGDSHPNVASTLSNLASLYDQQSRYAEAEPLFERALKINEECLGEDHPKVAITLNNLAALYTHRGWYDKAEPLYKRAKQISEASLGTEHPDITHSLNNLASLYRLQGRHAKAERLLKRSLRIREDKLGPRHPDVATVLNNLGLIYDEQRRYAEAEPLFERSLDIRLEALGEEHPHVAQSMCNLAGLYSHMGQHDKAEPLMKQALGIREETLGAAHREVANNLTTLAELYMLRGRYDEAEPLVRRVLDIRQAVLGDEHPDTADTLTVYNKLLRLKRLTGEAAK